jgi:hypothetical protein
MSRLIVTALFVLSLPLLAACGGSSETASEEPAVVEEIQGTELSSVTLTPEAAERLDIRTAAVEEGKGGTVVPYSAVVYSPTGETWTYTNPKGLTFVRERVVVQRVDGDRVVLSKGPEAGTKIATVGVPELYGAEAGIGADSDH